MDFPITRAVLERAESIVHDLAKVIGHPDKVPVAGSFRWEPRIKDAKATQVAKAVRAISGLRAALVLADNGFTVECATLLRTVADFGAEIIYLGEGLIEGRLTDDQQLFVEQHFAALPSDPDELAARERDYYIGRKHIAKAHRRLFAKWGSSSDQMDKIGAFLNKSYDSYVHGSNQSAMELFTGRTNSFMLRGHESPRHVCMAKVSVAGKLKEFLNALRVMALAHERREIDEAIRPIWNELDASREDAGKPCLGLT